MEHRYDDGLRGFGVLDSYQLNDCWRFMMTLKIPLVEPPEHRERLNSRLKAIYPPDQLDDAVTAELAKDLAIRSIILAAKSGRLPLWVGTEYGERLVAPNALIEFGKESVFAGCYRPENDRRNQIYGRPLFVKTPDFIDFLKSLWPSLAPDVVPVTPSDSEQNDRKFSDAERSAWIQACGILNADEALKAYKLLPGYDGIKQPEWRAEWRNIKQTKRGRPRKSLATRK